MGRIRADSRNGRDASDYAHGTHEEENVLRGFSLGADDYVAQAFLILQLSARIGAVLHRAGEKTTADGPQLKFGDLTIDISTKQVWSGSELIHLTPTEFKLLLILMRQPGKVVAQEELVKEAWVSNIWMK